MKLPGGISLIHRSFGLCPAHLQWICGGGTAVATTATADWNQETWLHNLILFMLPRQLPQTETDGVDSMKCRRFRLENGEGVADRDEVPISILFQLC